MLFKRFDHWYLLCISIIYINNWTSNLKNHSFAKSARLFRLDLKFLFDVAASVKRIESAGLFLARTEQLFMLLVLMIVARLRWLGHLACN